ARDVPSPRAAAPRASARYHHHLALDLAAGQVEQRLARLLERVALGDGRLDLAGGVELEQVLQVLLGLLRVATQEGAPEDAHQRAALQQREVERQPRDLARGKADDQVTAVPADRAEGGLGHRAADGVV